MAYLCEPTRQQIFERSNLAKPARNAETVSIVVYSHGDSTGAASREYLLYKFVLKKIPHVSADVFKLQNYFARW